MWEWFSGIKFWAVIAVIAFAVLWALNNLQWRETPLVSFSNPPSSRDYIHPDYTRRRTPRDDSFTDSSIQELDSASLRYIPLPPEEFRDCYEEELSRRETFDEAVKQAEIEALLNPPRPDSIRKANATESKGERLCKEAAEKIFGETFHRSIWPDWLRNPETGRGLELDLYCERLKIAIEYHGRQHYEYVPHFHRKGPQDFESQKRRDAYKLNICDEHGVYVITVPYYVPDNRLEQWIRYHEPGAVAIRQAREKQLA